MLEIIKRYSYALRTKLRHARGGCNVKNNTDGLVLMFHDVNEGKTDTRAFVSNIAEYREYISELAKTRTPCPLDEIVSGECNGKFAVTFDDGFASVYEYVYPFMKEHNIPFTVFVTVDFIDKEGYLTREQLKQLDADELCTIGSHCVTHPLLRKCKNAYGEMADSKELLEQLLGHEVKSVAYPYGSILACSAKNKRQAERAGYDYAFSAINGYMNSYNKRQRFFLPRFNGDPLVKRYTEENTNK
ncbi:MAG: polysaccharide deacetylase family protein [Clostridia bacterium]|nr:polysaccharide deacetylase family protein [Clostridia bacterium]